MSPCFAAAINYPNKHDRSAVKPCIHVQNRSTANNKDCMYKHYVHNIIMSQ